MLEKPSPISSQSPSGFGQRWPKESQFWERGCWRTFSASIQINRCVWNQMTIRHLCFHLPYTVEHLLNGHPCRAAGNQSPDEGFSVTSTSFKRPAPLKRPLSITPRVTHVARFPWTFAARYFTNSDNFVKFKPSHPPWYLICYYFVVVLEKKQSCKCPMVDLLISSNPHGEASGKLKLTNPWVAVKILF